MGTRSAYKDGVWSCPELWFTLSGMKASVSREETPQDRDDWAAEDQADLWSTKEPRKPRRQKGM